MKRLVLDRLWPMLLGLGALLAGALALQGHAERRGNDTVRIVVHEEAVPTADEEAAEADAPDPGAGDAPPRSPAHAQARLAARRAEWEKALPTLERLAAERPGDAGLAGELGRWLLAAGEPQRALGPLARADALAPTATSAYRLGAVKARLGDDAGAEGDLRRALQLRPGMGAARLALGQALRRRGATAEGIELLQAAAASGSNSERARALVALGGALLDAGRRAEAERALDAAVLQAPARAEVRLGVARAWLGADGRGDAQRALAVLARAVELAPDLPAVHAALGRARERLGDAPGAEEAYDRALRLDPAYRYARRRLLRLALGRRDFTRARAEADRLVADGPAVPEHHFLAAMVADRAGRTADARVAYRRAVEAAGGNYPEALLNLGVLEKGAGDLAAARAAYGAALALRPGYAAAHVNLGKLEEAAGRADVAEASYRRALQADPRSGGAWLALGQLLSDRRDWPGAEAALRQAIAARPDSIPARLSLGVVLTRSGRTEQAVAAYRESIALDGHRAASWFNLGLALRSLGRVDEARAALASARGVDPGHLPTLRELAALELEARRLPEAAALVEELLDAAPGDLAGRVDQALLLALRGDRAGCEQRARGLAAEAPTDERARGLAARCAQAR